MFIEPLKDVFVIIALLAVMAFVFMGLTAYLNGTFHDRRLVYLGAAKMSARCTNHFTGAIWDQTDIIRFYASRSGRRKIKGARAQDVCRASNEIFRWYYDLSVDPFEFMPPIPAQNWEDLG